MRRCIPTYLALVAGLGCSADGTGGGSERREASAVAALSVDSVPFVNIAATAEDGSARFLLAAGGTRLSSGVIVVSDLYDAVVRFFDGSGRLVRAVGRRGSGPGEFRSPSWVGQCAADSIFVWDPMLGRVTVLDSAGTFARQYRLPARPATIHCSRRGTFAIHLMPRELRRPDPAGKSPLYAAPLWLMNTRGDTTGSLGVVPLGENRPLGKVTRIALADDRIYVGTADSALVDVYGLDGRRLAALPIGVAPRAPTRRDYERTIDRMVAGMSDRAYRESLKRELLEIPMPDRLPPYTDLFTGPDGALWAVISGPGEDATRLRAIAADGRPLGEARLPVPARVLEVGQDYILGVYEAESGEQHVAAFRLRGTGGATAPLS